MSIAFFSLDMALQTVDETLEPDLPLWDMTVTLLNADIESSIITWWSTLLLTISAAVTALVAVVAYAMRNRDWQFFAATAVLFGLLSIDEQASIHEHAIVPLRDRLGVGGPFFFAWVIPALLAVAIFVVVFSQFVFRQPAPVKRLVIVAASLYVGGALGIEMLGAWWSDSRGQDNLSYMIITSVEELFEMAGASTYILAMLTLLALRNATTLLRFERDSP